MNTHYYIVDAFTDQRYQGAQVVVCPDSEHLNEQQMQDIARELNQQECIFVQASNRGKGQFELTGFSVSGQVSCQGHPMIATAYLMARLNRMEDKAEFWHNGQSTQACIDTESNEISKVRFCSKSVIDFDDFVPSAAELAEILGLDEKDVGLEDHRIVIAGSEEKFLLLPVKTESALRRVHFNVNKWTVSFLATLAPRILLYTSNQSVENIDFHARLVGKGISHDEGPAIAPAIPALAASLYHSHGRRHSVIMRGLGQLRHSLIEVDVATENDHLKQINVGGCAVISAQGEVYL